MVDKTLPLPGVGSKPLTKACEDYLDQKENVREAVQRETAKLDKIGEKVVELMQDAGKTTLRVTNERGGAHVFEIEAVEPRLRVRKEKKIRNED